ncbi:hypothetical protein [Thalassovita taeanensis]|uniref:hypothetical protein n=1 Tax=Thalassovita taeanensis TaxID=657014 RepID=UPI001C312AE1|nr:hypothetical protein [Thalassovita taeanensis]
MTVSVAERLGISTKALYTWKVQFFRPPQRRTEGAEHATEIKRLKRERIRRRAYVTRDAARPDVFGSIEMLSDQSRKHANSGMMSPVDDEAKQQKTNEGLAADACDAITGIRQPKGARHDRRRRSHCPQYCRRHRRAS